MNMEFLWFLGTFWMMFSDGEAIIEAVGMSGESLPRENFSTAAAVEATTTAVPAVGEMTCEYARELCDECRDRAAECLKVERCGREPLSDPTCPAVELNDTAVNNFCEYCSRESTERKCKEELADCPGDRSSSFPISIPFICKKSGAPCGAAGDTVSCCPKLKCISETSGSETRHRCKSPATPQVPQPGQPTCKKRGNACRRVSDRSCCQGLSCEKIKSPEDSAPRFQCVPLVNEPSTGPGGTPGPPGDCKIEGAGCLSDADCCSPAVCEELGEPGETPLQCIVLVNEPFVPATTSPPPPPAGAPDDCKKLGGTCTSVGDPSCCPPLSCERSTDLGRPGSGTGFECVLLVNEPVDTEPSDVEGSTRPTPVPASPVDATFSYAGCR